MIRCSKCLVGPTWDTAEIGPDGVCNICKQNELKNAIDWVDRKRQLDEMVAKAKADAIEHGRTYDCIVPVSFGKDSSYQLLYVVKDLGMKPLAIRFDHGLYRPRLEENFRKVTKQLGIDYVTFGVSFKTVREIMIQGLLRRGDSCVFCHLGIYAGVMQQVLRYKIPLVIWGEQISDYQDWGLGFGADEIEKVDETRFHRVASMGLTAEDLEGMCGGRISKRDLDPFRFPDSAELKKMRMQSVCLGSFIPWNVHENSERIKRELGWEGDYLENRPPEFWFDKGECQKMAVRDWLRFIKRGHSRATHWANIEIRAGRMTREAGLAMEKEYTPKRPASLDHFLEMWEMTEDEFMAIALSHQVPPNEHQHDPNERTVPPEDMPQWDKTKVPWPDKPSFKPLR